LNPDTSYETSLPKFLFRSDWTLAARGGAYMKLRQNGTVFLMIKPATLAAAGRARMKLRLAGTVNRLNPPQADPILMTLRFIDFITSEPQPPTSPSVVSSGSNESGSNNSLRQAQGLSVSKAAVSNFEGQIRSCSASSP
jgi:hypothetical protein